MDRTVNFKILDTVCRSLRPWSFQAAAGWWEPLQRLLAVHLLVLLVMMLLLAIVVVYKSICVFIKTETGVVLDKGLFGISCS